MIRVQFYPSEELATRLNEDAKSLNISTSALVVDLLNRHYHLLPENKLSLPEVTKKVIEEVAAYVKDPNSEKEFCLFTASKTFRTIEMVCDGRPQTIRASVGTSFVALAGKKEPFLNVAIVYRPDGTAKKSVNNAIMYKII